ncbi:hypothetical protein Rxycam_00594 [Rubrobacter xylanophilus DSM 9941]|uniref:hypothetical protein n=1 Tax=Rubrobacter xylanophilus TaxID=49319 RepID=UPI001C641BB3|nr:hypothetical protein [Rubrobacter xylanophilus]QYJ14788.1 hypothetical protein Rxycam_00594 [Rubrobacter xylanophilus DSM 9941]
MHTTEVLTSADFSFQINGQKASLEDIFPGFNEFDRLGVVVRQPGGATEASCLIMAAITRFYDFYRPQLGNARGRLRIYPEYFVFHVGKRHGNYRQMDIWPPSHEVIVENDPEQILEAINDRGVTRLLVEDGTLASATFLRETVSSAERRIASVLAYSPTGRVDRPDVTVTSSLTAEGYVLAALEASAESPEVLEQLKPGRQVLIHENRVTETYLRIELSDAIRLLTESSGPGTTTQRVIAESHPSASQLIT